jgi:hypothetical protein
MNSKNRGLIAGVILIALGLVFLVAQFLGGVGDAFILFLIGGAFVFGYFSRGQYGLLIPGGILLGLGVGSVLQQIPQLGGEFDTVGLGLGFVLIYIIDLLRRGTTPWWPLAPGGVLILVGLAESSPQFQTWFSRGWPVLLILFGLVLLVRTVREGSNRTE